jgi:hypothetical protein
MIEYILSLSSGRLATSDSGERPVTPVITAFRLPVVHPRASRRPAHKPTPTPTLPRLVCPRVQWLQRAQCRRHPTPFLQQEIVRRSGITLVKASSAICCRYRSPLSSSWREGRKPTHTVHDVELDAQG